MLKTTESIVIKCIKFKESSIITHVLTPEDGIIPLIVSGVRTKKNKGKAAQFQPGQLLEVVFYDKPGEGVKRLKESSIAIHYKAIPFDIGKIALTQYFIEITRNCLYQSAISSDDVYPLLRSTLLFMDTHKGPNTNLAMFFLWNMIDRMGLAPNLEMEERDYFDLEAGIYTSIMPQHRAALEIPITRKLKQLVHASFYEIDFLDISSLERKQIIEAGHLFLKLQLSYFKMPKSADIYREILKL